MENLYGGYWDGCALIKSARTLTEKNDNSIKYYRYNCHMEGYEWKCRIVACEASDTFYLEVHDSDNCHSHLVQRMTGPEQLQGLSAEFISVAERHVRVSAKTFFTVKPSCIFSAITSYAQSPENAPRLRSYSTLRAEGPYQDHLKKQIENYVHNRRKGVM